MALMYGCGTSVVHHQPRPALTSTAHHDSYCVCTVQGLKNHDFFGKQDPYAVIQCGSSSAKTNTHHGEVVQSAVHSAAACVGSQVNIIDLPALHRWWKQSRLERDVQVQHRQRV